MGLDNGITAIFRKEPEVPEYVVFEKKYNKVELEYEICYWRKCWNVRNMILRIIDESISDTGEYELNISQLKEIQNGLTEFLVKPKLWDDDDNTPYWEFDSYKYTVAQQIINLGWLIEQLEKNCQSAIVTFYDSY